MQKFSDSKLSTQIEISLYGTLFNFKQHPTEQNWVVSIGNDHDLSIWDLSTKKLIRKIQGSDTSLTDGTFTKNGEYFAYAANQGLIFLATQNNINQVDLKLLTNDDQIVPVSLAFMEQEDQLCLAVGTTKKQIYIFKIEKQQDQNKIEFLKTIELQNADNGNPWCTALFSDNISNLLFVFQKCQIDIWRNQNEEIVLLNVLKVQSLNGQIMSFDVKKDDKNHFFLLGDSSGTLTYLKTDLQSFEVIFQHKMKSAVIQVQFYESEQVAIVAGCFDNDIHILNEQGQVQEVVSNRAAPFLVQKQRIISRSDKVTRIAYIDEY